MQSIDMNHRLVIRQRCYRVDEGGVHDPNAS